MATNTRNLASFTDGNSLKIPVYADDAARNTAISSPAVGMLIYNTDKGVVQQYNAQGWESVDSPAGITDKYHKVPAFADDAARDHNTTGIPTPAVGMLIYNTDKGVVQQYNAQGWASIDSPAVITSITYPTESGAVLTALDADGGTEAAQTLIINGSNFSATSDITVQIQVSGSYVAFASSISVNSGKTQITCTGVTKRAAADDYVIKVTNASGLSSTTTVNFSADPSFSTAANLGSVVAGTFTKSIAFTGTKVFQGATTKPTWMTVTGNTSTADNGASDTTFDATGTPVVLGGTATNTGTAQAHVFSIIVRDAENQTFNRDFTLTVASAPTGGVLDTPSGFRVHTYTGSGTFTTYATMTIDWLVVGGGGGGAGQMGAGGGAGGFRTGASYSIPADTYTIVVGDGGTAGPQPNVSGAGNGLPSQIKNSSNTILIQSHGGGGGGGYGGDSTKCLGHDGGSGGGGASGLGTGFAGGSAIALNPAQVSGEVTTVQGFAGGAGKDDGGSPPDYNAGGGGGASAAGETPSIGDEPGGDGGAGKNEIMGLSASATKTFLETLTTVGAPGHSINSARYFAGGGGGAVYPPATGYGAGGYGGGGSDSIGIANTGGGGGGKQGTTGYAGGKGIIIIRYAV